MAQDRRADCEVMKGHLILAQSISHVTPLRATLITDRRFAQETNST